MKAGVILTSDFVVGGQKSFENYVRYIDREDAKKHIDYDNVYENIIENNLEATNKSRAKSSLDYENYLDYMNRDYAKSKEKNIDNEIDYGLFTNVSDKLDQKEKKEIYKKFKAAQENKSVLWRDVFSFDHEWLKEQRLLIGKQLNDKEIKKAVRKAMNECFDRENLNETGFWVAEIHYNTDNIHVHVASSETINTRPVIEFERRDQEGNIYISTEPKGKRSLKTSEKMKSSFISHLVSREKVLEEMTKVRTNLHHTISIDTKNNEQLNLLKSIVERLPENKNHWSYNHKNMKHIKEDIDQYTTNYIKKNHNNEYKKYQDLLNKEEEYYKLVYGAGGKERYKDYKKNKLEELNSRMGNQLLRSLKDAQERINKVQRNKLSGNKSKYQAQNFKKKLPIITRYDLYKIQRAFHDHRRKHEAEMQYKQMEYEIQRQNSMDREL